MCNILSREHFCKQLIKTRPNCEVQTNEEHDLDLMRTLVSLCAFIKFQSMIWILKAILFISIWLIVSTYQVAGVIDNSCKVDCACCKNQNCGPNGYFKEGNCYDGCIDGYRGGRCYEKCTHNCQKCDDNIDTCTECYNGYFLGPSKDCSAKCPTRCAACTSNTKCTKCKSEFYNDNGSTDCRYSHCSENCVCQQNQCVSCKTGYYDTSTSCSGVCRGNCETCSSRDTCDLCRDGYFNGHRFDDNNLPFLTYCTQQCHENCKQCSSYNECFLCKTGRYGSTCQEECSFGCKTSECVIDSGHCECHSNFSGDKCDQCKTGKRGNLCEKQCSLGCSGNVCDKESGNCLDGCIVDSLTGNTCNECSTGLHGLFCNKTCPINCKDGRCERYTGKCSNEETSSDPVNVTFAVVGSLVGLVIFITGVIAAAWFYRRRKASKEEGIRETIAIDEPAKSEKHTYGNIAGLEKKNKQFASNASAVVDIGDEQTNEQASGLATKTDKTYYNREQNPHRVNVDHLLTYVTKEHVDLFENEFKKLNEGLGLTENCSFARKPENIAMNRYNGIYPYNHSRVTIPDQPGFYINACYIDGYNRRKAYITSLGPTAKTTDTYSTFWSMVWSEKSDVIVMLTNLREASGMKCEQYWPETDSEGLYGQVKVKSLSVETYAEYTVRTFTISKGKEKRNVLQLHYTAWPDKGVPLEVTSLVEFRQRVKAVTVTLGGPVIVHCSAGVGRTGTYIALDQLTEEGKCERSVDVFNCVNRMREQRVNMVQTAEQYIFLHKSLVHSLSFGCEALTAEQIQRIIYDTDGKMFSKVYQTLRQEVDLESKEDMETREENKKKHKDKNRRDSDIPADSSRVRLYLSRKDGQHDYINAVFINSFKTKNLFIAAQSPLPRTTEDFLSMIYQQNCTCVIALEDPHCKNNNVGNYLPADNETYTYGHFIVSSSKCETKTQYALKKLSVQTEMQGEAKVVYHFQYKNWGSSNKVPDSAEDFVQFIKEVENYIHQQAEDTPHLVVHCLNGYERSGLFCVVYKLLEKLEAERQVSVVNTVRKIRTHRKQSITSVEQLKFCYQCIAAYMEIYNTYTNYAT